MSEQKTTKNRRSVDAFLSAISDEAKRRDCYTVMRLMKKITGTNPQMWGNSMVGFGTYHYKYGSGREGDWFLTGFSPRKQNLTLYIISGFSRYEALMKKLGKCETGKSCLYIKKLEDIDLETLRELVQQSVEHVARSHP
ncbi:MAG: DUF1801 domain-containing protein [Acidobacteria bacterium]|nr:DUF1801 domain-containing protein [Acidobacteriota bacterium]